MIRVPGEGATRGGWGSGPVALVCRRSLPAGAGQGPAPQPKDRRRGPRGARHRAARSYLGTAGDNSALDKHPRRHLGTSCCWALAATRVQCSGPANSRPGRAGMPGAAPRTVLRVPLAPPRTRDAPTPACPSGRGQNLPPNSPPIPGGASNLRCHPGRRGDPLPLGPSAPPRYDPDKH